MKKRTAKLILWVLLAVAAAALIAAGVLLARRYVLVTSARTSVEKHDAGEWFDIAPEGIVSANGSPVHTQMRIGTENKVIVFFYGGGISLNQETAARPYVGLMMDVEPGFYSDDIDGMIPDYCDIGLTENTPMNPFRDWTVIIIPYTTADFHVGAGEYGYTALDGGEAVLRHHGYENYRAIMDEAVKYTGVPDELLVAGYSAGGYGAVMLTEDLMQNYFPDAGHVTVCVDSSLLILDNWKEVFEDVWNAPEQFVEKIHSSNIVVDYMGYLYDTYGDALTYLYIGSVRDGALTRYQTYFDIGIYAAGNQNAFVYTQYLRRMVRQLREAVPTIGFYIFDNLPFSFRPGQFMLTQHTLLVTRTMFMPLTERTSAAQWLMDGVNGNVRTLGMSKLW